MENASETPLLKKKGSKVFNDKYLIFVLPSTLIFLIIVFTAIFGFDSLNNFLVNLGEQSVESGEITWCEECPVLTPPAPGWCEDGTVEYPDPKLYVDDGCYCPSAPICIP